MINKLIILGMVWASCTIALVAILELIDKRPLLAVLLAIMAVGSLWCWNRSKHSWYWTPKWQAWEKEADEDLQAGRYEVFDSMNDLIASLDDGGGHPGHRDQTTE